MQPPKSVRASLDNRALTDTVTRRLLPPAIPGEKWSPRSPEGSSDEAPTRSAVPTLPILPAGSRSVASRAPAFGSATAARAASRGRGIGSSSGSAAVSPRTPVSATFRAGSAQGGSRSPAVGSGSRPGSRPLPTGRFRAASEHSVPQISRVLSERSDSGESPVDKANITPKVKRRSSVTFSRIWEDFQEAIHTLKEHTGSKAWDSLKEVSSALFKMVDSKSDGILSKPEFLRFTEVVASQCSMFDHDDADFQALDTDGDRSIDEKEFYTFLRATYRSIGKRKFLAQLGMIGEMMHPEDNSEYDPYRDLRTGHGCVITLVQDRGITLPQLRTLLSHMKKRCVDEVWKDTGEHSPTKGKRLQGQNINLYHTTELVIKPATAQRCCSYVEFVATGPQTPKWFVSHFWGEPVQQFIACLTQHCHDRMLPEGSPYWVCAYANNQWDIAAEMGSGVQDSSFRKAMDVVEGTVSVLDAKAQCWNRVWCCYEVWVSIVQMRTDSYKYDMYTTTKDKAGAVGITDGCAAIDMESEFHVDAKQKRQRAFPLEICKRALQIRLQDAEASSDLDRKRILNSIIGAKRLDHDPPVEHERYEELNQILRGIVATSTWRDALENGLDMTLYKKALMHSDLPKLEMSFDSSQSITDNTVKDLLDTVSEGLQELDLDLSFCSSISDLTLTCFAEAMAVPKGLQRVALVLMTAAKRPRPITDKGLFALAQGLKKTTARDIDVNLHGCKFVTDDGIRELIAALPPEVSDLAFDFAMNPNITTASVVDLAAKLTTLSTLKLNLHYCSKALTSNAVKSLARAIPGTLREVHLDFRFGEEISSESLTWLFAALQNAPSLRVLEANCSRCPQLTDNAFPDGFAKDLQVLKLSFAWCPLITDHAGCAMARALPKSLKEIMLNVSGCEKLSVEGTFLPLARNLPDGLERFELWLHDLPCAKRAEQTIEKAIDDIEERKGKAVECVIQRSDRFNGTALLGRPASSLANTITNNSTLKKEGLLPNI